MRYAAQEYDPAIPVGSITEHPKNTNEGDVGAITMSVERYGWVGGLVVQRSTRYILSGNHSYRTAVAAGAETLPGFWVDMDDAEAVAFMMDVNHANRLGREDPAKALALLMDLRDRGAPLPATYDASHVDQLLADLGQQPGGGGHTDPDDVPPAPEKPVTRRGDVWELAAHRLICGDSTDPATLAALMAGGDQATLIYTDPPYGVDYRGGTTERQAITGDQAKGEDLIGLYAVAFSAAAAHGAAKCGVIQWHADKAGHAPHEAAIRAGWRVRCQIIWVKNMAQYGAIGAHYHQQHESALYFHRPGAPPKWNGPTNEVTVWHADRSARNDWHSTQKPVELAERAMRNHTDLGDVVLDMFAGSGSALIAAHRVGRVARCAELDRAQCDVIVRRFREHTGIDPVCHRAAVSAPAGG